MDTAAIDVRLRLAEARVRELSAALEEKSAEVELLHEVAAGVAAAISTEEMLDYIAETAIRVSHTDSASIYVLDDAKGELILRAVKESGGAGIAVSEDAILQAVEDAAHDDGFLLCPEGGAVLAAWRQALGRGLVRREERVLLFNCANGNKYPLPDRSKQLNLAEARPEDL